MDQRNETNFMILLRFYSIRIPECAFIAAQPSPHFTTATPAMPETPLQSLPGCPACEAAIHPAHPWTRTSEAKELRQDL